MGTTVVYLEADAPRVRCSHGVVVAAVPWARTNSRFTRAFGDTCAWLAAHCSGAATAELLRVAWLERVVADALGGTDRFGGVTRGGIDEIAHRKGHRYLTVVPDTTPAG